MKNIEGHFDIPFIPSIYPIHP